MLDAQRDPIREVRTAKRWAVAGILVAVCFLLPLYGLTLGLSAVKLGFVLFPAAVAGFFAVELAAGWEYRTRRRYAYPQQLGYEIAAIHDFAQACRRGARVIVRWLEADAAVVAWLTEDGEALAPVGACGLPAGWLDSAPRIPLGAAGVRDALQGGRLLFKPSAEGDPWFGGVLRRERIIYVPLFSRDRLHGVLAIAGGRRNAYLGDLRLLSAMGLVMGLALDNCRLYEGQRAHAEHLELVNRQKSDFLGIVSHELRTPLTSMMMASEMLLEEEDARDPGSDRGRLVRAIVRGTARLTTLVADLGHISREDELQPRLELELAAAGDVIGNAVSIVQPLFAAKGQRLEVSPAPEGDTVLVDRLRFEQVLINLLSNAQRFSPPGGNVGVSTRYDGADVVICVTDSGPGVPEEDRERVFEPFYRGDRTGMGLGLAIAHSLVERHHGRIWVEPAGGEHGSSFCVALPLQPSPAVPAPATPVPR